jgi:hypothetical protein
MARYLAKISTPWKVEEAFRYMSDFSNCAHWDPSVVEASRLTRGRIARGSRFRVVVSFLGRTVALEYAVAELEAPHRLVLVADTAIMRSLDEISFVPLRGGTQVIYDARLSLKGMLAIADPCLQPVFSCMGARSEAGLAAALSED